MGLLNKSLLLSAKKTISSSNLIESEIVFYAFFKKKDNKFFIHNSFGLDFESIFLSSSTSDFWEGSIKKRDEWIYFSKNDNSILQFYQFFSIELKDLVKSLAIYFTSNDEIILLGNSKNFLSKFDKNFAEELLKKNNKKEAFSKNDFKIKDSCNIYTISIDIASCTKDILSKYQLDEGKKALFAEAVNNEIQNQIKNFFDKNHYCFLSQSLIKIILFSKKEIKEKLLQSHLISSLNSTLGSSANLLNIKYFEKSFSSQKVEFFLQVE